MFWNGVAAVLSRGLPVLGMIVAARILGREAFGQLGIAHSTAMMLQVFAVAGLGTTATTFVARWRKSDPERAGRIMVLCYGFTCLLAGLFLCGIIVGAERIADTVLAAPELAGKLYIAGFLTFAATLSAVQTGMLIGFQAYRDMAAANLIGGAAGALLVALGARWAGVDGALWGLTCAQAIQSFVNAGLLWRAMRRDGIAMRFVLPRDELPILWRFSMPGLLTMALWAVPTWTASALLVRQPNGMGEMGLLAAANQWFAALMFVPGVLTQVLLPIYSERVSGNRRPEARRLAGRSALAVLMGMALLVTPMVLLSPSIAGLYGTEFRSGAAVFAVLFLTAVVAAPYGAMGNYLVAEERMWTRFHINVLWAVVLLAGAVVLIERGALGVTLATLIAFAVRTAVMTYAYLRPRPGCCADGGRVEVLIERSKFAVLPRADADIESAQSWAASRTMAVRCEQTCPSLRLQSRKAQLWPPDASGLSRRDNPTVPCPVKHISK
jgi:O-antigen/teichoic acid export membrane protein